MGLMSVGAAPVQLEKIGEVRGQSKLTIDFEKYKYLLLIVHRQHNASQYWTFSSYIPVEFVKNHLSSTVLDLFIGGWGDIGGEIFVDYKNNRLWLDYLCDSGRNDVTSQAYLTVYGQ